eukprot:5225335-Alexandrium_andersonii.AAC.1
MRKQDADVWGCFDSLRRAKAVEPKGVFERREMASGLNDSPYGLLADDGLRAHVLPVSCHTDDA